ncbi:MAG: hypothetical protein ACLU45_09085 [Dialister invisus]|jgi:hypothetical protein|uniref:hypothetical protein n=1 Tax=Dialister invisus TaxID=218538 RepID=UPI003999F8E6
MKVGLRTYDENGNCTLDITDSLTRILGSFRVESQEGSKTVTVRPGSRVFVFPRDYTPEEYAPLVVSIVLSGDNNSSLRTISWVTRMGSFHAHTNAEIYYGSY